MSLNKTLLATAFAALLGGAALAQLPENASAPEVREAQAVGSPAVSRT